MTALALTTLAASTVAERVLAWVVAIVLLLVVGSLFWLYLRRASRRGGRSHFDLDPMAAPRLPEPPDPRMLPGEVEGTEADR